MRPYLGDVDFETIKQRFDAFWAREILDRPLIYITAPRTRRKKKQFPNPKSIRERWTNIKYVMNKMELHLENTLFLGDAIPWYLPNIGPNSFTAFLGGELLFMDELTSWVYPFIEDLAAFDPVLDEDNKWWKFMKNLLDAVCEVAEGNFLVGIPDLHYGGDCLEAAVGARKLIRHLFQEPGEVNKLMQKLTELCIAVFESYYEKISRVQKGSTTWIPAYSKGRYLALQDDFSGLVSPSMFTEFFLEEQIRLSRYMGNSIFHLDGPMALGNLDILLEVESLNCIQWVPGAGAKPMPEWVDICAKVLDAGKCLQIGCLPTEVGFLLSKLKHEGLFITTHCSTEKQARSVLKIAERCRR